MRRTGCSLLVLVLFSLLPVAPAAAGERAPRAQAEPAGRAAAGERLLHRLGKSLALSLDDEAMRARLHKMLGETPYVEGRVALKRLLGDDAELRSTLLGKAADWSAASAALPELELYFPSREHRSSWTGGPDIDVAVALGGTGLYRVYSPDGSVREMAAESPAPERPTLLLGRSEIDYDDHESAMVGGRRTGPILERLAKELAAECVTGSPEGADSGQPGKSASSLAKGADTAKETTLTLIRIKGDFEPWVRGSMEIEVFGNIDGGHGACTRISDVDENRDYTYAVGARRVANAAPTDPSQATVTVYEDDDTGCSIQGGDDFIGSGGVSAGQMGSRLFFPSFDITLQTRDKPVCGDSRCDAGESPFCCDCNFCGNRLCICGETYTSCYFDCSCGDFFCDFHEDHFSCPQDCTCGNFFCDFGEDQFNCPQDCSPQQNQ